MTTGHPNRLDTPETRGPSDESFPMGHFPPRRTLPPAVASALWTAREESNLSNREIAEQAGIDPSFLSKIVRGNRCPSQVVAARLIDVLPLTVGEQEALRDVAVQDAGKSRQRG
jgi:ribosome-binding protein aMBF1 (putative translation factor)